jgi:hypothetical protein
MDRVLSSELCAPRSIESREPAPVECETESDGPSARGMPGTIAFSPSRRSVSVDALYRSPPPPPIIVAAAAADARAELGVVDCVDGPDAAFEAPVDAPDDAAPDDAAADAAPPAPPTSMRADRAASTPAAGGRSAHGNDAIVPGGAHPDEDEDEDEDEDDGCIAAEDKISVESGPCAVGIVGAVGAEGESRPPSGSPSGGPPSGGPPSGGPRRPPPAWIPRTCRTQPRTC